MPNLKFDTSLPSVQSFASGVNAGPGIAGMGAGAAAAGSQVKSSNLNILKYPLDLATTYRHYMEIVILKQSNSSATDSVISRGNYNWDPNSEQIKSTAAGGYGKVTSGLADAGGAGLAAVGNQLNETVKKVYGTEEALTEANNLNVTRKASNPVAYIHLYMPDTMMFDLKQDFDKLSVTDTLGNAGMASNLSTSRQTGEFRGAAMANSGVFGDAKDVTNLSVMSNGYALNPQMEILFKGPQNRQFRYQFKFTPRNQQEANMVNSLIATLRFHACPEYAFAKTSRYFIPPSEFRINHMIDSLMNSRLPRIGQCVLEEVNVNFAASGQYSTFKDGTPVEIQMDLTFTEVNILTKNDVRAGF